MPSQLLGVTPREIHGYEPDNAWMLFIRVCFFAEVRLLLMFHQAEERVRLLQEQKHEIEKKIDEAKKDVDNARIKVSQARASASRHKENQL